MGIVTTTVVLIFPTVAAGYSLWTLLLHYEDSRAVAQYEVSHPGRGAMRFLTLTGLIIIGTLAALLAEVQQLFAAGSS
jgi:hypothetical protein